MRIVQREGRASWTRCGREISPPRRAVRGTARAARGDAAHAADAHGGPVQRAGQGSVQRGAGGTHRLLGEG